MKNNLEIFEIAPHPSEFTLDLLKKIYSQNGPVDRVYQKYRVKYKVKDFFVYKDGNLWIDKDVEKQSIPLSLGNIFMLSSIHLNNYQNLYDSLKTKLNSSEIINQVNWEAIFLKNYELVFEIDLLFSKAIKKLEVSLGKNVNKIGDLLSYGKIFIDDFPNLSISTDTSEYLGNSIEVQDRGKFTAIKTGKKDNPELIKWWHNLSEYQQVIYQKSLITALIYSELREFGRWLVVKNISQIRPYLNTSQLISNKVTDILPNNLPLKVIGVSGGIAMGILADKSTLSQNKDQKLILFTPFLSPELTDLLDKVEGIVSTGGGMMSHLAIVSREMSKPVVVGVSLSHNLKIGDMVKIDGSNSTIEVIK
ncbi:MAG: PEP-utilizing enzyme [Candidatus Shapirobacteria bacterium]